MTCKIRRIKCDEGKPVCTRCSSTGRTCEGYQHLIALPLNTVQINILTNKKELRSYQYFRERTSSELSSYYDRVFWNRIVLQTSYSNLALNHVIAAIGALHESLDSIFDTSVPPWHVESQRHLAIQQCNKAIALLTHEANKPPPTSVVLLSCILFMTFDYLENRCEAGLDHLSSGVAILNQWRRSPKFCSTPKSEIDLIEDHLAPMLQRSTTSAAQILESDDSPLKGRSGRDMASGTCPTKLPEIFLNIQDAHNCLQSLLDHMFASIISLACGPLRYKLEETIYEYQNVLRGWLDKFNAFSIITLSLYKAAGDRVRAFQRAADLLKVHCRVGRILISTVPYADESHFDAHLEDFEEITSLCRELIELEDHASQHPTSMLSVALSFSFDLGIISPLFLVGSRCRNPELRREAIRLLYVSRRREGVWSAFISAMVVERIVMIEESTVKASQSEADIPAANRLRLVRVSYDPGWAAEQVLPGNDHPPVFVFRWVRSPFNEVDGPFEEACFPLTEDELAERRSKSVLILSSSWLSNHRPRSIHSNVLEGSISEKSNFTERQMLTTGRFNAPWDVTLSYRIDQDYARPLIGQWQYLGSKGSRKKANMCRC